MAYDSGLPVAYLEEGPVVTFLGEDEMELLELAEPSPVMVFMSRWWRRFKLMLKIGIVAGAVGAYPAAMVASHTIDDSPVALADASNWQAPHIGVAITSVAKILEQGGWAGDKANWHPQSRLTAMPAWQEGIAGALADHTRLMAVMAAHEGEEADQDLSAAARLLAPLPSEDMRPRLTAAAEAMNRYDGRLARGLAVAPDKTVALMAQAELFTGWAVSSRESLSAQINRDVTEWPASRQDIETYYHAKAEAYVAHQMLVAATVSTPSLTRDAMVKSALNKAERAWGRAAAEKPLIVSNQNGNGVMTNHLAAMAYHMVEANEASDALVEALRTLPERTDPDKVAQITNTAP